MKIKRTAYFTVSSLAILALSAVLVTKCSQRAGNAADRSVQEIPRNTATAVLPVPVNEPEHLKLFNCLDINRKVRKTSDAWDSYVAKNAFTLYTNFEAKSILKVVDVLTDGDYATRAIRRELDYQNSLTWHSQEKFKEHIIRSSSVDENTLKTLSIHITTNSIEKIIKRKLSRLEDVDYLLQELLTVEHLVKIIQSKKYDEETVIELINLIRDPNASIVIGDGLLNTIVKTGKINMLKAFVAAGGTIADTEFGSNALEQLITHTHPRDANHELLSFFSELGLTVRYYPALIHNDTYYPGSRQLQQLYELGAFSGNVTSHLDEYRTILLENNIVIKEGPGIDEVIHGADTRTLYTKMSHDKEQFIKNKLGDLAKADIDRCVTVLKGVNMKIQNTSTNTIMMDARQLYGDDTDPILDFLQLNDPFVAECFRNRIINYETTQANLNTAKFTEAQRHLHDGRTKSAIESVNSLTDREDEKSAFFWDAMHYRDSDPLPLIEGGIAPNRNDFSYVAKMDVGKFSRMAEAEWNFGWTAPDGSGLVKHAASKCNTKLITELRLREYEYSASKYGVDPLAIGINAFCKSNDEKILLMASLLAFEPPIQEYHRRQINNMKYTNYELFRLILEEFPELNPETSTSFEDIPKCFF